VAGAGVGVGRGVGDGVSVLQAVAVALKDDGGLLKASAARTAAPSGSYRHGAAVARRRDISELRESQETITPPCGGVIVS